MKSDVNKPPTRERGWASRCLLKGVDTLTVVVIVSFVSTKAAPIAARWTPGDCVVREQRVHLNFTVVLGMSDLPLKL